MTFIHPLLFGGLALVGVPILLHLLMRQKPKYLLFPAFRFLQKRARTNQRKIRIRHLLLLLLRMLLIALLCLALIRPRMYSDRPIFNQDVNAVLVFDTSASMDYSVAGKSRLDEAKQQALELLDELGPNSRVAIVDTGGLGQEWGTPAQARETIRGLVLQPGSVSVTTAISAAYRQFDELDRSSGANENETLPRFLYVLSDRTVAAWDVSRLADLQAQRDRLQAPKPFAVFMDVGVDKPVDVAITDVEVRPSIVASNQEAVIKAFVQATGQGCDTEILCRLTGETTAERKPLKLGAGQSQVVEFRTKNLKPGQYQAEITLATPDAVQANNARFLTFEVRGARRILTITDNEEFALFWQLAFEAQGDFDCAVTTPEKIESAGDWKSYLAVCLFSVRQPADSLWIALDRYVSGGGHLVIVPGRDVVRERYGSDAAKKLLPGQLETPVALEAGKGAEWNFKQFKPLFLAKFKEWKDLGNVGFMQRPRKAARYWLVHAPKENVIVSYAKDGADGDPALLERVADRKPGSGRVLMFTTPLDHRPELDEKSWNDYLGTEDRSSFYMVIANEAISYSVGDKEEPVFNFSCGQVVSLLVPSAARVSEYVLDGPGISGPDTRVLRADADSEVRIRATSMPGNFTLSAPQIPWHSRFSLNTIGSEFQLDRVPIEEIERLLGPDALVPVGQNRPLREVMTSRLRQPMELLPWIMGILVIGLAVEALAANRFYKDETAPSAGPAAGGDAPAS